MKIKETSLALCCMILLCACSDDAPQASMTPKDRLLNAASEIVSSPNAWNTNSRNFADFVRASVELQWEGAAEIKDFKAAAVDLNIFSTQWVERLDTAQLKVLSERLQTVAADARLTASPEIPSAGHVNIDSDTKQKQIAEVFSSSTGQLTKDQSEQYGVLYKKLIDAYERLYRFALNTKT